MLEEGLFTRAWFLLPVSTTKENISSSPSGLSSMAGCRPGQSYTRSLQGNTAAVRPRSQSSDLVGRQCSTSLHSFLPSYFLTLLFCSPSLGEGDIDILFMAEHSPGFDSYCFDHVKSLHLPLPTVKGCLPKLKTMLI